MSDIKFREGVVDLDYTHATYSYIDALRRAIEGQPITEATAEDGRKAIVLGTGPEAREKLHQALEDA